MGGGKGKVICNIGQLGQWLKDLQASTCHREIQGEGQEKKKEKTYLIRSIYLILTSALYARSTAKHEKTTYGVAIRQNGNCPPSPPTSSKNPPQREKTETETKLAKKRTNAQGENGKVEIKVLPKLHTVYHAEKGSSLSLTTGLESIL